MRSLRFYFCLLFSCLLAQAQSDIRGLVLTPSGSPAAGLTVHLDPGGADASTGPDGKFAFQALAPGAYQVTVTGLGYVPLQETVSAGGPDLELRMATVQSSVEVRAESDTFLATASVGISKSPASLLNLPYAIQVLPRALLEDRAIQDVKDLYRNISGMADSPYSAMTLRGFTQREVLYNGVRGNPYGSLDNDISNGGFSTSQGRLSNIEYVEVLKGPAAVLFGGGEPGGVVNYVTRKPRNVAAADLQFRMGSFRQLGGSGDVTAPLWKSRGLFGRTAWYQEDRKVFRYNARNQNFHWANGLSWRASEATSLGLEYEYIDQLLPGHRLRGIPVDSLGNNLAAREWSVNEPGDFSALQARVFQTRLDHAFTPTLRTDVTFRYLNYDRPERYHEPRGINADGTMRREYRDQYRSNDDWSLTANGYERFDAGKLGHHNLVFGMETVTQDWNGRFLRAREAERGGPVPALSLRSPVYGRTSEANYTLTPVGLQSVQTNRTGVFAQDQIEISPRLQMMIGGRVERFNDTGFDQNPLNFRITSATGRAGIVYRIAPSWSAFASVGNGLTRAPALAQTSLANGPFDPERSRQVEGGAKGELAHGRVLVTGSLYRITKTNVLRPDPALGPSGANDSALLAIGKVRNQGLELDATGRLTRDLSVVVNYTLLDSKILEDRLTPSAVSGPMPNAPRHSFGLFARYDLRKTGTGFTVGNESRSRRFEPYAGIRAAGYGIWDFGVFQRLHRNMELRLQLDNAFDKTYATSSLFAARAGNWPGAPRTFTASIRFNTMSR